MARVHRKSRLTLEHSLANGDKKEVIVEVEGARVTFSSQGFSLEIDPKEIEDLLDYLSDEVDFE